MKERFTVSRFAFAGVAVIALIITFYLPARRPGPPSSNPAQSAGTAASFQRGEKPPQPARVRDALPTPAPPPPARAGQQTNAAVAPADEVFGQFRDWFSRYQQEDEAFTKARLEGEGEVLARQRRDALAALIETDPQHFRIRSFNELGTSAASNTANARTKAK